MIDLLTTIANLVIVIVNIILVYVIYRQFRLATKPIITTKIISREKNVDSPASVLESGILYLVVSNVSDNVASNLRMHWDFLLEGKKITEVNKVLMYLNPKESIKELLGLNEIMSNHPELFDKVEKEGIEKTIPKKALKLSLNITIAYNFPKYRINDSYDIEWGSLESYPNFEDHPIILCWNRRDGIYIYKLEETR